MDPQMRRWRDTDREPFAALNADPEVMRYFPAPLTCAESDALADRIEAGFTEHSFGLWALEVDGVFIGFTGLAVPRFRDGVEVGWRLARHAWGHGYATRAARRALDIGFTDHGLDEIVAFTSRHNRRSRSVMIRTGMTYDPADDFEHPNLEPGHPLRPHVLYRAHRENR